MCFEIFGSVCHKMIRVPLCIFKTIRQKLDTVIDINLNKDGEWVIVNCFFKDYTLESNMKT